ncbi:hypothetical protein [Nocardia vinacea]|uniref:hypothetical protein n=1 Tax=Nocardia vinacea TaxID=96468 RepID=UPI0002D73032|nr:hypothetical protein [Nocardia vinacea]
MRQSIHALRRRLLVLGRYSDIVAAATTVETVSPESGRGRAGGGTNPLAKSGR